MKDKLDFDDIYEEEGEGTWLQTFADMSMLLLTFFILMYSYSSINKKIFNSYMLSIKKALIGGGKSEIQGIKARSKNEEGILLEEARLAHQIIQQQRKVFSDFNFYFSQHGIEGIIGAKFDKGKIIIDFNGNVLFAPGQVQLSSKGKEILRKLRNFLLKYPYERINIVGHTDDTPPSPQSRFKDNWEISTMRAVNVLRFFSSLGISPDRMTATGLADTRPIVPNISPENRQKNRRVSIILEREIR
ncbi:OmpA family protein [Desulfothermus naphthae]